MISVMPSKPVWIKAGFDKEDIAGEVNIGVCLYSEDLDIVIGEHVRVYIKQAQQEIIKVAGKQEARPSALPQVNHGRLDPEQD